MDAQRVIGGLRSRRAVALAVTLAALAQIPRVAAEEFYAGKTLTVIVGFAPGGGVDTTARTVARHLVRFIPGQPGLVVQNMEAAAGLIAATHMTRRVAPDGLTLAVPGRSWFIEGIVKSPGVTFDPTAFSYIGSPGAVNSVMYVRAGTGVTSFDKLKTAPRTLIFGALRSNTPTAMVPAMLARRGVPIRPVPSYGSTARVLIALRQGEVDGFFTVEDSFAHQEDMIESGLVVPILQTKPKLANVPVLRDLLPAADGPLLTLVLALEDFGLPLVGPPGMPEERVALLRQAMAETFRDKDFLAETDRINFDIRAMSGEEVARIVHDTVKAPPDIVAKARAAMGEGASP